LPFSPRAQARLTGSEEGREIAFSYRFNHLNRNQFVELSGQVAIVAQQYLNLILQACLENACLSPRVLLA
jgi:hypothetical protein